LHNDLTKIKKKVESFNLNETEEAQAYSELLSESNVKILDTKWSKQEESESFGSGEGASETKSTSMWVYVTYEEIGI
jgi:hypothetical protein